MRTPRTVRQSADDHDGAAALRRLTRQVADDHLEPDERTPAEQARQRAEFRSAWAAEHRRLNPTPQERYLDLLAFCAAVLQRTTIAMPCEEAQYVALFHAQKVHLGRPLMGDESTALRFVSRRIWIAREMLDAQFPGAPAPSQVPAA